MHRKAVWAASMCCLAATSCAGQARLVEPTSALHAEAGVPREPADRPAAAMSICELGNDAAAYDGTEVAVRGRLDGVHAQHSLVLFDLACPTTLIALNDEHLSEKTLSALGMTLWRAGQARDVDVEGLFVGTYHRPTQGWRGIVLSDALELKIVPEERPVR